MVDIAPHLAGFPDDLRDLVERYWQDFSGTARQHSVPLDTLIPVLPVLVRVWASSDFVARTCIREPRMLPDLLAAGRLQNASSQPALSDLDASADPEALSRLLRRHRRREMLVIAWRDLAGIASLEETLGALSLLADGLVQLALDHHYRWLCERFGVPRDRQGKTQRMLVLGMGKLGGQELNFSSDIDLIFTYPENGETDGQRTLSNEEFFRRLGQRLIAALNEVTEEGFVFRVDMRLRPFGEAGPLAMPVGAMLDYYQHHGREWERYAMIKVRVIAGPETEGQALLDALQPFVYRRYLDYGAIEALRTLKEMIVREVERRGLRRHIKLGQGGIRELEFIVQLFQLIYGGREPALRQRSFLATLETLAATQRLPASTTQMLAEAYRFHRTLENRLQAMQDRQVHEIPFDALSLSRLSLAMGFAPTDGDRLLTLWQSHCERVSEQFVTLFQADTQDIDPATRPDLGLVWEEGDEREILLDILTQAGFQNPEAVLESLTWLRQSSANRTLGKQGRQRMDRLIPRLLEVVATVDDPATTLERICRLLEAVAQRTVYLALLVDQPQALQQLVHLCSESAWIGLHLSQYPILLDELLDPARLYTPLSAQQLRRELDQQLERLELDDQEQIADRLRQFKQINELRVAAAEINGTIPLMVVSDYLTAIAEVILEQVLRLAWQDLIGRFGVPAYQENEQRQRAGFAVIAYGKFGGIELGYGSDLDLVFLHDSHGSKQETDGPRVIDNPTFFARLAQRIIHWLTIQTRAGVLYEVDTRLRPSGRSGLLVSSLDAFGEYQRNQAWTWEHQALVRARAVAGTQALRDEFGVLRRAVLTVARDREELREAVRQMRERMRTELGAASRGEFDLKQDRGGMADIEFMVQYLVMAHASEHPTLTLFSDNLRQLAGLEANGILPSADAQVLRTGYLTLRQTGHRRSLQNQSAIVDGSELLEVRESVIRLWQRLMERASSDTDGD